MREIKLLKKMEKTPVIQDNRNEGVSETIVELLEQKVGRRFPLAYREFLLLGGENANMLTLSGMDHGTLQLPNDTMPVGERQQLKAKEELTEVGYRIEKDFWVFADLDGCQQFHCFFFDEGDDPIVHHYCSYMPQDDNSEKPELRSTGKKFSQYIDSLIDHHRSNSFSERIASLMAKMSLWIGTKLKRSEPEKSSATDIIDFNDTDFDENIYDPFTVMYYKGKPFTGTVRWGTDTIEYKDGDADGWARFYYPNGQLSSETEYRKGEFVQGTDWYEDGTIESVHNSTEHYERAKDGTLAYESRDGVSTWYYRSGAVRQRSFWNSNRDSYYASNGQLAFEVEKTDTNSLVTYYDSVLLSCFKELITNEYPELYDSSSYGDTVGYPRYCFQLWVLKLLVEQSSVGAEVLRELENFEDTQIKDMADTIRLHSEDFSLDEVAAEDYGYCSYKLKT